MSTKVVDCQSLHNCCAIRWAFKAFIIKIYIICRLLVGSLICIWCNMTVSTFDMQLCGEKQNKKTRVRYIAAARSCQSAAAKKRNIFFLISARLRTQRKAGILLGYTRPGFWKVVKELWRILVKCQDSDILFKNSTNDQHSARLLKKIQEDLDLLGHERTWQKVMILQSF